MHCNYSFDNSLLNTTKRNKTIFYFTKKVKHEILMPVFYLCSFRWSEYQLFHTAAMIVCATGPLCPPTAFKCDYLQDKFNRVCSKMHRDKCWRRWPQENQDKIKIKITNAVQTSTLFIWLSFPCWKWLLIGLKLQQTLIGLWWPCSGRWTTYYFKVYLTMKLLPSQMQKCLMEAISCLEYV